MQSAKEKQLWTIEGLLHVNSGNFLAGVLRLSSVHVVVPRS